jgi:hypothetical protein
MDRSPLHELYARAELVETRCNLVGRFVGERKNADSVGVDVKILDEKPDALDQAERLPRTRSGEDENRT